MTQSSENTIAALQARIAELEEFKATAVEEINILLAARQSGSKSGTAAAPERGGQERWRSWVRYTFPDHWHRLLLAQCGDDNEIGLLFSVVHIETLKADPELKAAIAEHRRAKRQRAQQERRSRSKSED